jgi:hypothetical protein
MGGGGVLSFWQAVTTSWHLVMQPALHLLMHTLNNTEASTPADIPPVAAVATGMFLSRMVGQQHGMPRHVSCCMAARTAAWCSCWWMQVLYGRALLFLAQQTARTACGQPSQPSTVVQITARWDGV